MDKRKEEGGGRGGKVRERKDSKQKTSFPHFFWGGGGRGGEGGETAKEKV